MRTNRTCGYECDTLPFNVETGAAIISRRRRRRRRRRLRFEIKKKKKNRNEIQNPQKEFLRRRRRRREREREPFRPFISLFLREKKTELH